MMNFIRTFVYGATVAFGLKAGADAFNKLKDPVTRVKLKKKFKKVKDAIFSKEES